MHVTIETLPYNNAKCDDCTKSNASWEVTCTEDTAISATQMSGYMVTMFMCTPCLMQALREEMDHE